MKKPNKEELLEVPHSRSFHVINADVGDLILKETKLEVGQHYWIQHWFGLRYVRFIKVTRKGFNFLDEESSRCILPHHLYAKGYAGKDIPVKQKKFTFLITNRIRILKVAKAV